MSPLVIIFITVFIDLLGFGIIIPLLPFYAESFGASAFTVGLLGTSFSLMQFLFSPVWGRLSDRIGRRPIILIGLAGSCASYLVLAVLFSLIYKWVPQAKVAWTDVWMGALLTTLLYVVGSMAIIVYLGHSALVTFYGGAGSLVLILLWAYYASQIFLFGASFIAVYASEYGSHVVPAEGAVAVRPATESDEEQVSKRG